MLTDQEKEKIRLEEVYRQEVAESLKAEEQNATVRFFNSNLGLWLLSAIFISGAGTLYSNWQEEARTKQLRFESDLQEIMTNVREIDRLDLEISYRLSASLAELKTIGERAQVIPEESDLLYQANRAYGIVQSLALTPSTNLPPLFPEHAGLALPTLMAELQARVQPSLRKTVGKSLSNLLQVKSSLSFENTNDPGLFAARYLNENILLNRWSLAPFDYMDCDSNDPFC